MIAKRKYNIISFHFIVSYKIIYFIVLKQLIKGGIKNEKENKSILSNTNNYNWNLF